MNFYIVRLAIVILGLITSIVCYYYIVKPYILEPLCLIDSNGCVRMGYYSYNNSVLIHMRGSGLWVWYNGDEVYIYGQPVGQLCEDPSKYTAAYAVSAKTGAKKGYKCVMILEQVIDFYVSKGVQMEYLYKRVNEDFSVYDVINLFADENIIDLSTAVD